MLHDITYSRTTYGYTVKLERTSEANQKLCFRFMRKQTWLRLNVMKTKRMVLNCCIP